MGVPAPLEPPSGGASCKGLDLCYMLYLMLESPKGSEHLYFNGISHQDAAKLIACFMVYLGFHDDGILSWLNSHTISEGSQCIWESGGIS